MERLAVESTGVASIPRTMTEEEFDAWCDEDVRWVVDPQTRRMDAYRLTDEGRYATVPLEEGVYRSQAVPGFWLRPDWLWQDLLPNVLNTARELGIL